MRQDIFKKIQKKYPRFEYVGGYRDCCGKLYLMCKDCGTVFPYNAQVTRPSYKSSVCCPACRRVLSGIVNENKKHKNDCRIKNNKERNFVKRFNEKYGHAFEYICGYDSGKPKAKVTIKCKSCGLVKERNRRKIFEPNQNISCKCGANRRGVATRGCDRCGKEYVCYSQHQPLCKECHDKEERIKKNIHRRLREAKAKNNGKIDYTITLAKLIERDNGICQLCGREVNESDYVYVNDAFVAGNDYPSIDHIKPLSKGGVHQWDNVQLAHRLCNSNKCDKYE